MKAHRCGLGCLCGIGESDLSFDTLLDQFGVDESSSDEDSSMFDSMVDQFADAATDYATDMATDLVAEQVGDLVNSMTPDSPAANIRVAAPTRSTARTQTTTATVTNSSPQGVVAQKAALDPKLIIGVVAAVGIGLFLAKR